MYGDTDTSSSEDARDDYASQRSDVSDTSSEVTELEQADFPAYFIERGGRLFHSHGNSPYPLPVDADEQQVRFHRLTLASNTCPDCVSHPLPASQRPAQLAVSAPGSSLSRPSASSPAWATARAGLVYGYGSLVRRNFSYVTVLRMEPIRRTQGLGHGARFS